MSVMYLLIMISLILASGFVIAFVWAIRSGQYDDKYTPSVRVLFDDLPVDGEQKPEENVDEPANRDLHQGKAFPESGHQKELKKTKENL